jgi:hypothetical protein
MALLKCPDCTGDVSSESDECRRCGRPFASFARTLGMLGRFIIVACLIGITMRICGR